MPEIDKNLCIGCGKCLEICGFCALKIEEGKAVPDNERCISCGMCAGHCPVDAISVAETKEEEKSGLIKNWADTYARKNSFRLNPRENIVDLVIRGLLKKEEKTGKRYCPCRIQNLPENICPCVYHKDEIKKDGECHCVLFVK